MQASKFGFLGSVDSNTGDPLLGWDTDQFPMDFKKTTLVMQTIIEQGGLAPGGLNFDAKVRRESSDVEDMFIAHVGAFDTFARGLRNAARLLEEGVLPNMVKERYSSFDHGFGKVRHRNIGIVWDLSCAEERPMCMRHVCAVDRDGQSHAGRLRGLHQGAWGAAAALGPAGEVRMHPQHLLLRHWITTPT